MQLNFSIMEDIYLERLLGTIIFCIWIPNLLYHIIYYFLYQVFVVWYYNKNLCDQEVDDQAHAILCPAYDDLREGMDMHCDRDLVEYFRRIMKRRNQEWGIWGLVLPSSARLVPDCVLRVMHFNKFTLLTVRALKYKYKYNIYCWFCNWLYIGYTLTIFYWHFLSLGH